jgi:hypothetical protein
MDLKSEVKKILKTLPRTYFFKSYHSKCGLVGGIKGRLTYFLILEPDRNFPTTEEINLMQKIRRCNGDAFVIKSIHDFLEICKVRGYFDD